MTDHLPLLAAEVDRQLAEISAQGNGVADRAGILLAASGIAVGFLQVAGGAIEFRASAAAVTCLTFSVVIGISALTPRMSTGPSAPVLTWWRRMSSPRVANLVYQAKLITLVANRRRLLLMRGIMHAQILAVGVSIALTFSALIGSGGLFAP